MTSRPSIHQAFCGQLADGSEVTAYTLDSGNGMRLTALNLGGIVTAIETPDRDGHVENVVLRLEQISDYVTTQRNFGALVGRCANRIEQASFDLDGQTWQLEANDGPNTLHGGPSGFATRLWSVDAGPLSDKSVSIALKLTSEHLDGGFPGKLNIEVVYTVSQDHSWRIDYMARSDRITVVNLTHHAYFNLSGSGTALNHILSIFAECYMPVDPQLLPLEGLAVDGTPFDFRSPHPVGERIRSGHEQLILARGYDHNWILDRENDAGLVLAAILRDPESGRSMTVETKEPGLQFYSGNFLDGSVRGANGQYRQSDGLCLETQHYPDSPRRPNFPSVTLRPKDRYRSTTVYRFRADSTKKH